MRIGHYNYDIWAQGGVASYIWRVGQAQAETGHKVHYYSQIHSNHKNNLEKPSLVKDESALFHKALEDKLDILHLHSPVTSLPLNGLPIIRTVHGHAPFCPSGSRYLGRWQQPCNRAYHPCSCLWGHIIDRCGSARPPNLYSNFQQTKTEMKLLRHIPVIAVSSFVREQMIRSGYPEDNIQVLHSFAPNAHQYVPPPQLGIPRFLFLGRLSPQKGPDWLLRALKEVKQSIHLDIAGDGYILPELKRLVSQLGLEDQVTFHGWVNQPRIMNLIQSTRAIIFPSLWHEPAGLVTLEAAAAGRAVIASNVGGIPEYASFLQNALLVEPGSISDLAQKISRLASDWNLSYQLGKQGRERAEAKFSVGDYLSRLTSTYEKTILSKAVLANSRHEV